MISHFPPLIFIHIRNVVVEITPRMLKVFFFMNSVNGG